LGERGSGFDGCIDCGYDAKMSVTNENLWDAQLPSEVGFLGVRYPPAGINAQGNSCHLSTALSMLASFDSLGFYLQNSVQINQSSRSPSSLRYIPSLQLILSQINSRKRKSSSKLNVDPSHLISLLQRDFHYQSSSAQDLDETVNVLFDAIDRDLDSLESINSPKGLLFALHISNSSSEIIRNTHFHRSILPSVRPYESLAIRKTICYRCLRETKCQLEIVRTLRVLIPPSGNINEAVKSAFDAESNTTYSTLPKACRFCSKSDSNSMIERTQIIKLASMLIIQICRVNYDRNSRSIHYDSRPIQIPNRVQIGNVFRDLRALGLHLGPNGNTGHYFTCRSINFDTEGGLKCSKLNHKLWYCISDHNVKMITNSQLLNMTQSISLLLLESSDIQRILKENHIYRATVNASNNIR